MLRAAGREDLVRKLVEDTNAIPTIAGKVAFQKKYTFGLVREYPRLTALLLAKHAGPTLLNNHWIYFGHYWGYHWAAEQPAAHMHMKKSTLMLFFTSVWTLVYLVVTGLFLVSLRALARERQWLLLTGLVLLLGVGLIPGLVANSSPRLRLPLEGIIVMGAFAATGDPVVRGLLARGRRVRAKLREGLRGA